MSTITNQSPSGLEACAAESDVFDPAEALDRACGDLELFEELTVIFKENRDHLLNELTRAVTTGDAQTLCEAGHAIKGSISTFSTKQPYLIARELEFCGKEGRMEAAPQLLEALKVSMAKLEVAVQSFLESSR